MSGVIVLLQNVSQISGFIGYSSYQTLVVQSSSISATLNGYQQIGGLAGFLSNQTVTLTNVSLSGNIFGSGGYYVGNLAGYI